MLMKHSKMSEMTHASVFSGIGASELAAEMLGWKNLFHCEINEFGRKVLNYHFPNARSYEDVTTTDFSEWRGKVTVLTGGFPCQPFSCAGSEEARKMTATSGRTCSIALSKSDPLGLLAKMLLESPRWHSKVRMLKWENKPICSEKVTVMKSVKGVKKTSLGKSAQILKVSVIPSKHSLFQLVPWEPPTEGTECLSSRTDLLKTPTAFDAEVVSGKKSNPGKFGKFGAGSSFCIYPKKKAKPSANTTSERGQQIRKQIQLTLANGKKFICDGRKRASPNSKGKRSDRYKFEQPKSSKSQSLQFRGGSCKTCMQFEDRWRNFPSVSPICRGDDGFPFRVDSFTIPFARWRKESLKAYGNAIVPQVIYQIFLMIDEIEKME